jgi:hypothetical protein
MHFGVSGAAATEVTAAVRKVTSLPLMVKLSPEAADICEVARVVEGAGEEDQLVTGPQWYALTLRVEYIAFAFQHIATVVHVVPMQWQLFHALGDVCRGPEIQMLDVIQYFVLALEKP